MTALLAFLAVSCLLAGFLLGQMIQQRKCDREIDALKDLHNLQMEQALIRENKARDEATRLMDSVLAKNQMAPVSAPAEPVKPTAEEKRPRSFRDRRQRLEEFGKLPAEKQMAVAAGEITWPRVEFKYEGKKEE